MKLELRSVRLKNCGPIDDIKIDFFDAAGKTLPVCVIGGANGSGKTTVLEAIVALVETFLRGAATEFLQRKLNVYAQIDCRFADFDASIFYGNLPEDAEFKPERYGIFPPSADVPSNPLCTEAIGKIQAAFINAMTSAADVNPTIVYLPHSRSLEPVSSSQIHKETDAYQLVHRFQTVREFPGSLASYLIWLDYAKPDRFLETQRFLNDLNFDGKTFWIDREALDVLVKTNGHIHRLHELSSGEQNLLIILIELRRKLRPGSVVLIDEIENSLHPAYQHRLAQGLLALQREIPYQLIVTTHAPAFVEIFGEENTRILTPF
ncbi:MAG TPA: AAA family ATPase [Blastocatellia bacterium]|nr:AAA family ATPase [Blastocatellia bacterium]HMV84328.1 AAA family ATPase [Blastocatellia bacterium]HMX27633.1 AAA family ATPase [Blastocatellia bacterium]HMZ19106.1 AAA family ATPase [Blastocatellia bacterium]HNG30684.1 AAA family ATPase [Blastocatellia bacterium]